MAFSDYIVYVDESGDHGLATIDPSYPVFVLAFCIFEQAEYTRTIVPAVQQLKFEFFGHDMVILHSHEIRKAKGEFNTLLNPEVRERFVNSLSNVMAESPFTLVAAVINKIALRQQYVYPANPYEIAMTFCLERTYAFLDGIGQSDRTTNICFERRGKREDDELELAFRRCVAGANMWGQMPFEIRFASKQANSTGLQIADLAAYPVGRSVIRPNAPNPAYDVVKTKFRRSPTNRIAGWGKKVFP